MNTTIEISDIVLSGINFSERQTHDLCHALQRELTGLVASDAKFGGSGHSMLVPGIHVETQADASPYELASGLAVSIGRFHQSNSSRTS